MVTAFQAPKGGTRTDIQPEEIEEVKANELRKRISDCKAQGGTWNGKECILPDDFSNVDIDLSKLDDNKKRSGGAQGKVKEGITGEVVVKDGKTFLGPGEAKNLSEIQQRNEIPDLSQQFQAQEAQRNLQDSISKIGKTGGLTPTEEAATNFSQALVAGAAGSIPGIIGGAATGAVAGAVGGPIGIVGGAALGGIATFVAGVLGNIKAQQRGELGAAKIEMAAARTNMRQLAMFASRDPGNADQYIESYNKQLLRVQQAQVQTLLETTGDLNSWIEDGRQENAEFDVFLRDEGIADIYGQKLKIALETGTPLSIVGDQLLLGEEENE